MIRQRRSRVFLLFVLFCTFHSQAECARERKHSTKCTFNAQQHSTTCGQWLTRVSGSVCRQADLAEAPTVPLRVLRLLPFVRGVRLIRRFHFPLLPAFADLRLAFAREFPNALLPIASQIAHGARSFFRRPIGVLRSCSLIRSRSLATVALTRFPFRFQFLERSMPIQPRRFLPFGVQFVVATRPNLDAPS